PRWSWLFQKGKAAGLSVAITGGKVITTGRLTFNEKHRCYRLEGMRAKPAGGPIAFEGKLDSSGKVLELEQVAPRTSPSEQSARWKLSIRPNSNFVRYSVWIDRLEPGSSSFGRFIDVGGTRQGECFAAGSATAERPKCIVTGGAASMTMTYDGRSFPICCTGCRDEFNENPQKYLKLASLKAEAADASPGATRPSPARAGRFD